MSLILSEIPPDLGVLGSLSAVLFAVLDGNGHVVAGNQGFGRLLPEGTQSSHPPAQGFPIFVKPTLDELLGMHCSSSPLVFEGILNLADAHGVCRSFVGAVYRRDQQLILLAEYDVNDMERLNAQVIDLNLELAELQRDLARSNRALKASEEQLRLLSVTDPLTGLFNRRHLMNTLNQAWEHGKRHGFCLSMIVMDIDFFKKINDQYGHDQGDVVLKALSVQMQEVVRKGDVLVRMGGEEFAIVLQDTPLEAAKDLAERLRLAARSLVFESIPCGISCSYGVATLNPVEGMSGLLRQADEALYASKHAGRDRVTVFQEGKTVALLKS